MADFYSATVRASNRFRGPISLRFLHVGASCIIAILGFVALHNSCDEIPAVIIWWLIYTIGCGVVLGNTDKLTVKNMLIVSAIPAILPVLVALFLILNGKGLPSCVVSLSGDWTLITLPFASWFFIFIFSYVRLPLEKLLKWLLHQEGGSKIKEVITVIQLVIGGVAAVALALSRLGS